MKSLYDKNEGYTREAGNLEDEIRQAVAPILRRYMDEGWRVREVMQIGQRAIEMLSLERLLEPPGTCSECGHTT